MGFPKGNLGMVIAAIVGGLSSVVIVSIFLLFYFKRKKKLNGYPYRPLTSNFLMTHPGRQSRAKSCFDVVYTVHENGKAPEFSIPVTKPKTRPKRTCQLQFSLLYNFHTSILKIQVMCVVNLPRLFGLQSGVFVKVHVLSNDGEMSQNLGKTATQFRSKNPVFKDSFVTTAIPYEQLQEMKLSLSLYSYDRFSQSHFVGSVGVKFKDINLDPLDAVISWRPVQPKSEDTSPKRGHKEKGELILSLRYQEKTSRVNVVVMKAINLSTPKRLLRTDPYVLVKLFCHNQVVEKKRTQPCKRNLNPVWNEPFVFDLQPNGDKLAGYKFIFEIKSSDVVVPDASLGKVEIYPDTEHWKEMMAKKNYARAMCHQVI